MPLSWRRRGTITPGKLQPPPIIDDDLTAAITDTESGHLRAARLTQRDCIRAGNQTVKTYTFRTILSVSDESSYVAERQLIFGSSCILDLNLLDWGSQSFADFFREENP